MPVSRDQLKSLFFSALDRAPHERSAFIEGIEDQDARNELRALLAAHDSAESFLERGVSPEPVAGRTLVAGQRLGPYEVLDLIGRGGMGEVYRARDTRLGRLVAVKVLPAAFGSDAARQRRFEDEARAASALSHPNVLTLYDVGTLGDEGGATFIVMELLDGETLRRRLARDGPLPRAQAIDFGLQMARGLAAARRASFIAISNPRTCSSPVTAA